MAYLLTYRPYLPVGRTDLTDLPDLTTYFNIWYCHWCKALLSLFHRTILVPLHYSLHHPSACYTNYTFGQFSPLEIFLFTESAQLCTPVVGWPILKKLLWKTSSGCFCPRSTVQAVCSDDVEICFFLERMVMMGFTKMIMMMIAYMMMILWYKIWIIIISDDVIIMYDYES